MKTIWPIYILIIVFFLTSNGLVLSQDKPKTINKYDNVIEINDTPLKSKEWKSLTKPKKHKENEVIVKRVAAGSRLNFQGENAYTIFYYYMEDNKLKSNWVQIPGDIFDQLHYTWEPNFFYYKLENSKTGEKSTWVHNYRKLDQSLK